MLINFTVLQRDGVAKIVNDRVHNLVEYIAREKRLYPGRSVAEHEGRLVFLQGVFERLQDDSATQHNAELLKTVEFLCTQLTEASTQYADLLKKYGKAHCWGMIAVQSWREAVTAAQEVVREARTPQSKLQEVLRRQADGELVPDSEIAEAMAAAPSSGERLSAFRQSMRAQPESAVQLAVGAVVDPPITLEAFAASGKDADDIGAVLHDTSLEGVRGRIYLDAWWIMRTVGGRWYLELPAAQHASINLSDLESRLYHYILEHGEL